MRKVMLCLVAACSLVVVSPLLVAEDDRIDVDLHSVDKKGIGKSIGTITIREVDDGGLVFVPTLSGLDRGLHGFHIHQNNSCETSSDDGEVKPAGAAGSHFDPEGENQHAAPWEDGHLGDLPPLYVDDTGKATQPVFKPAIKITDVRGHAIIVHANGDNYSDHPEKLGGGGARVACGLIK